MCEKYLLVIESCKSQRCHSLIFIYRSSIATVTTGMLSRIQGRSIVSRRRGRVYPIFVGRWLRTDARVGEVHCTARRWGYSRLQWPREVQWRTDSLQLSGPRYHRDPKITRLWQRAMFALPQICRKCAKVEVSIVQRISTSDYNPISRVLDTDVERNFLSRYFRPINNVIVSYDVLLFNIILWKKLFNLCNMYNIYAIYI